MNRATSCEETMFRVRRDSDKKFLARDRVNWTDDSANAWETSYPPVAGAAAYDAQEACGHTFFAEVVRA